MAENLSKNGPDLNGPTVSSLHDARDKIAELLREQKAIGADIKALCAACDDAGFASKKEVRKLARESLMDQDVLKAQLDRMAELRSQLGVFADTELGQAAISDLHEERDLRKRKDRRKEQADIEDFTA